MKKKNIAVTVVVVAFFLILSVMCWVKPQIEFSTAERRALKKLPEISIRGIMSGKFMTDFEDYALDQFPLRDKFRTLKSLWAFYCFNHSDNNNIYINNGYASKLEFPLKEESVTKATKRFEYVYDKYIAGNGGEVYLTIIPDKNYFIAKDEGYPSMDYDKLISVVRENTDFSQYIDITKILQLSDYYKTDTHWKQESIVDVAEKIAKEMGVTLNGDYKENVLDNDFYGVYYGQSALPLEAEKIKYLTNDILNECNVYDYQNGKEIDVYDMEKAYGKDPYEMFLSGSLSLVSIENPNAKTEKELVIFRDSFGSSIAPLLAEGYKKIILVDIRYIHPDMLAQNVDFKNKDVLFMYSTLVLNNGETIK